ncbi:hypothetical protein [uncultured Mitsuokella sp.]|uniref:hypothetical protein n=1 Tax=uncultured Mitsuokella sp. TaxID=453120 RepID=UPI00260BCD9F|nr:hypothetical protein [uncultured Mitsuokella sp.]
MNKTIYMNDPLLRLAEETKGDNRRNGGFSSRLGEIVERYKIILDLTELPQLTEVEMQILSEIICGSMIDRRKIRGLHLDVLDAALGTDKEKAELYKKLSSMTAGQRIKLIEQLAK